MEKVRLYLLDTRPLSVMDILKSFNFSRTDIRYLSKIPVEEVKKEKAGSLYLKNKYIGHYNVDDNGKPYSDHTYFNVSHSKGIVALAIASRPVGVDIELVRDYSEDVARFVSSDEELGYIKSETNFFEIWTSKESLVKCLGIGLKQKVNEIPALPLVGLKEYQNKKYICQQIHLLGLVISITLEGIEEFEIDIQ